MSVHRPKSTKGGSPKYKAAEAEYKRLVEELS
jgi:hypothetical protein